MTDERLPVSVLLNDIARVELSTLTMIASAAAALSGELRHKVDQLEVHHLQRLLDLRVVAASLDIDELDLFGAVDDEAVESLCDPEDPAQVLADVRAAKLDALDMYERLYVDQQALPRALETIVALALNAERAHATELAGAIAQARGVPVKHPAAAMRA